MNAFVFVFAPNHLAVPIHLHSPLHRFPLPPYPVNSPQNDADAHGSSGMRTRFLLYGRGPHSLPRRDYRIVRGPHFSFLFRALPSGLFLRGICSTR